MTGSSTWRRSGASLSSKSRLGEPLLRIRQQLLSGGYKDERTVTQGKLWPYVIVRAPIDARLKLRLPSWSSASPGPPHLHTHRPWNTKWHTGSQLHHGRRDEPGYSRPDMKLTDIGPPHPAPSQAFVFVDENVWTIDSGAFWVEPPKRPPIHGLMFLPCAMTAAPQFHLPMVTANSTNGWNPALRRSERTPQTCFCHPSANIPRRQWRPEQGHNMDVASV